MILTLKNNNNLRNPMKHWTEKNPFVIKKKKSFFPCQTSCISAQSFSLYDICTPLELWIFPQWNFQAKDNFLSCCHYELSDARLCCWILLIWHSLTLLFAVVEVRVMLIIFEKGNKNDNATHLQRGIIGPARPSFCKLLL